MSGRKWRNSGVLEEFAHVRRGSGCEKSWRRSAEAANRCCVSVVCSALDAQGSEDTYSSDLARATGGPASGEGLVSSLIEDDELEVNREHSGGEREHVILHGLHSNKDEKRKRKGKGKGKHRPKDRFTTPLNPEHTVITRRSNSTFSTTQDPCTSTHLGYCIYGSCKYMEGLQEPVCVCMKGYDGERCGIQILGSTLNLSDNTELVQTVLVVIAIVLSVISCCAVLLMTCAHYRSHKNFLASYLGTGSEQEKLQKPMGDIMV